MFVLSPMSPEDENVPTGIDFSALLATSETIASVTSVTALPATITVGQGSVTDGAKPNSAVQFTLGAGQLDQGYTVTAEIVTSNNVILARSCYVPVRAV